MIFFGAWGLASFWFFGTLAGRYFGFGHVSENTFFLLVASGLWTLCCGALVHFTHAEARLGIRTVIFLSPEGYLDIRQSKEPIPWTEIRRVSSMPGRAAHLRLYLSEEMTRQLYGRAPVRRAFRAIAALSFRPIFTSNAVTLKTNLSVLEAMVREYAAAHGGLGAK